MLFQVADNQVQVEFWHEQETKVIPVYHREKKTTREVKAETNCLLTINGKNYLATAYCSVMDQFDKAKGRVIAFSRALQTAGLSREERTALWTQYWQVVNPTRMKQPF